MGFKDVFKKSFLEGFTSMDISAGRIMATFAVTCILACYVFLILIVFIIPLLMCRFGSFMNLFVAAG